MNAPSDNNEVEKFSLGGGHGGYRGTIQVGLVNNMPDAAMRATELQFARLLKESAGALDVQLHLFSLPDIERGEVARSRMEGFYADTESLHGTGIDALIITGAEPRATNLADESYWPSLTQLIDWAESGTVSTMFSCLAAHAAVQHISGLERAPLEQKSRASSPPREWAIICCRPACSPVSMCRSPAATPFRKANWPAMAIASSRGLTMASTASPKPCPAIASSCFCRAIPNTAPRRWAANICATWAASCAAKWSAPGCRRIILIAPRKIPWPNSMPRPKARKILCATMKW